MNEVLEQLSSLGIVPVIALNDSRDASPLAGALCAGGLPCAEVTFRTEAAEESLRIMSAEYPQMLTGAGTILTTGQVDRAVAAGAKFIVSPGLNPTVVKYCVKIGIPVIPGCTSPSDIERAIECGLDVVKFFPAEAAGGLPMIKAMSAPYTGIKFMPTGGITAKNLTSYLDFDRVTACGGSWMADNAMVKAGDFAGITVLTREAVSAMLGFEILHIGIHAKETSETDTFASDFKNIFGLSGKSGPPSAFTGTGIDILPAAYPGTHGCITVAANYLDRAVYHLKMHGIAFREEHIEYRYGNKPSAIYLEQEYGAFAVKLVQKNRGTF